MHYEKFADGNAKCIEDEIPFELPQGWEWCRLRKLFNICSSKRVLQSDWKEDGIPFYRAREIVKLSEHGEVDNELFISVEHYNELKTKYGVPQTEDLMVSGVGTIGKVYIVKGNDRFYYKDASVLCFQNVNKVIRSEFAKYLLESEFMQSQMHSYSKGTTVDTITISTAMDYLCFLPPIPEQHRIVEKLNELLSFVDTIESDKTDLQKIIQQTKSKILDLAIRGKLVPQDPNDEPASVLLERIRTEKEELIKQGKIKRDKKESVIFKGEDNSYYEKVDDKITCIDEEIPFEIPDSWIWCRLENCCNKEIKRGKSPKYAETGSTLVFAQKCNTKYSGIDIGLSLFLDNSILCKYPNTEFMQDGDIVINSTGTGTLGRVGIYRSVDNRKRLPIVPDSHITIIRTYKSLLADYVYAYMKASQSQLEKMGEGSTNQKELKPLTLKNFLIPIPPKEEQKAIASKIAALFSYLDSIAELLD